MKLLIVCNLLVLEIKDRARTRLGVPKFLSKETIGSGFKAFDLSTGFQL